jgi:indolepyruvate ferredoxin oxidoreductase beta subunit
VVKGYGDTHANGMRNFNSMMAALPILVAGPMPADRLAGLRAAALADETGTQLAAALPA